MTVDLTMGMISQNVSHTWRTTIQANKPGTNDKRSALFTWPRLKFENKIQPTENNERGFMDAQLQRNIFDDLWGVPILSDKTVLTAQAASGQKILAIEETDYRHFYPGRKLILLDPDDWESYEVATIDTIDSSVQITVVVNLVSTWPADTKVLPYYECRITDTQETKSNFPGVDQIDIEALESFESQRTFSYTVPTIDNSVFPLYKTLPIFTTSPRAPVNKKYRFPYNLFGGIGLQTPFSIYDSTRKIFDREFQTGLKKDIYDILDFFDANQGRLGEFYTPTWLNDIVIAAPFNSIDTVLTTSKIYFTDAEMTGRDIFIRFPDGTYEPREIVSLPSNTSVEIDSAIGTTISAGDVPNMKTSFLWLTRFNQDEIMIDYVFQEKIAKINLAFNTL